MKVQQENTDALKGEDKTRADTARIGSTMKHPFNLNESIQALVDKAPNKNDEKSPNPIMNRRGKIDRIQSARMRNNFEQQE